MTRHLSFSLHASPCRNHKRVCTICAREMWHPSLSSSAIPHTQTIHRCTLHTRAHTESTCVPHPVGSHTRASPHCHPPCALSMPASMAESMLNITSKMGRYGCNHGLMRHRHVTGRQIHMWQVIACACNLTDDGRFEKRRHAARYQTLAGKQLSTPCIQNAYGACGIVTRQGTHPDVELKTRGTGMKQPRQ